MTASKSPVQAVEYRLRRSERAKHTRIVVKADGSVEVVAPLQVSDARIRHFVQQQHSWIERAQQRLLMRREQVISLAPSNYQDGALIPYLGKQITLELIPYSAKRLHVVYQDQRFKVYVPLALEAGEVAGKVRLALVNWMKLHARQQALALLARYAQTTGLQAKSLTLKTMKSRWGSCGPHNDINLNWLLVLGPPIVMEYVIVHELCHIRHKNHSADFWRLVAQIMPDYLQHRQWLKHHGAQLMLGL